MPSLLKWYLWFSSVPSPVTNILPKLYKSKPYSKAVLRVTYRQRTMFLPLYRLLQHHSDSLHDSSVHVLRFLIFSWHYSFPPYSSLVPGVWTVISALKLIALSLVVLQILHVTMPTFPTHCVYLLYTHSNLHFRQSLCYSEILSVVILLLQKGWNNSDKAKWKITLKIIMKVSQGKESSTLLMIAVIPS